MKILIVDYGAGNLFSLYRALEECGGNPYISDKPADLERTDKVILPGVGSFQTGMKNLTELGWIEPLRYVASQGTTPVLGICLGMQLLSSYGHEHGQAAGLGLIPGEVPKLCSESGERVPHVGWNAVFYRGKNELFNSIDDGKDFYFVHSYHFVPDSEEYIVATTPYCQNFVSVINRANIYGVQFHPEKSSKPGLQLLKNYIDL